MNRLQANYYQEPWTPDMLATLYEHLLADNATQESGARVVSVTGRKGLLVPAATTGGANRPTYLPTVTDFGGKAGIQHDGVANILTTTSFAGIPTGATEGEVYLAVAGVASTAANNTLLMYGNFSGTAVQRRIGKNNTNSPFASDQVVTTVLSPAASLVSGCKIIRAKWTATAQGIALNGSASTDGTISSLATGATGRFAIGATNANTPGQFTAFTWRHIFFTGILSLADRQRLEGWIAADCGQNAVPILPASHPYARVGPILRAASTAPLRCVTNRGEFATGQTSATGGRTRFKWSNWRQLPPAPSSDLRLSFDNYFTTNDLTAETNNGSDLVLNKVGVGLFSSAGIQIGSTQQVLFSGIGTATLTDGVADLQSDPITPEMYGLQRFPASAWLNIKGQGDMASGSAKMPSTARRIGAGPLLIAGSQYDQQLLYDPANETADDILVPGLLLSPTGATGGPTFKETMVVGRTDWPVPSVWIGLTSIEYGSNDLGGVNGQAGGGYLRRAAASVGFPYCSYAKISGRYQYWASQRTRRAASFKYFSHFLIGSGTNDLAGAFTTSQILAFATPIWADMWASGAKGVYHADVLPRPFTADFATTLSGQVPNGSFAGSPSERDLYNTALAAAVGQTNQLSALFAVSALAEDPTTRSKWAIRPYSSTLVAVAAQGASTVVVRDRMEIGDIPVFGSGATLEAGGPVDTVTDNGNGTFSVSWSGALANAHPAGEAVLTTNTEDGTHPGGVWHAAAGALIAQTVAKFNAA